MNITILGCGVFGIALAKSFQEKKNKITMWSKFQEEIDNLKPTYPNIKFTTNLKEATANTDLITIAIPIAFLENTIKELQPNYPKKPILIASKGIDTNTLKFAFQIVNQQLNNPPIAIISGGTFAKDMGNKKVMGLTLATTNQEIQTKIKKSLESRYLKIQTTKDLMGVSICGSIKNVMAIALGILDGASYPESSRFLFLTEAIYEINNFILKSNGSSNTIMSYAGLDDIMMTCTSEESRNYTLGKMLGQKKSKEEIENYKQNTTIEGLGTSKAIYLLTRNQNIDLPITKIIYEILYQNQKIEKLITYLEEKEV